MSIIIIQNSSVRARFTFENKFSSLFIILCQIGNLRKSVCGHLLGYCSESILHEWVYTSLGSKLLKRLESSQISIFFFSKYKISSSPIVFKNISSIIFRNYRLLIVTYSKINYAKLIFFILIWGSCQKLSSSRHFCFVSTIFEFYNPPT